MDDGTGLCGLLCPQPRHHISIDIVAITIAVSDQCAFDEEAEFFVEPHGRFVVGVDFQLQPAQVQPLVRQVNGRLHERRTHALTLPIVAYRHANVSGVTATWVVRGRVHRQLAHHFALDAGHQFVLPFFRLCQTLAPPLEGGEGHLRGAPDNFRPCHNSMDSFVVTWFRPTD